MLTARVEVNRGRGTASSPGIGLATSSLVTPQCIRRGRARAVSGTGDECHSRSGHDPPSLGASLSAAIRSSFGWVPTVAGQGRGGHRRKPLVDGVLGHSCPAN
jgi:hypothetical protein